MFVRSMSVGIPVLDSPSSCLRCCRFSDCSIHGVSQGGVALARRGACMAIVREPDFSDISQTGIRPTSRPATIPMRQKS